MLGLAGHFSLEGEEVCGDAVDVKVDKGLLTFLAQGKLQSSWLSIKRFSVRTAG